MSVRKASHRRGFTLVYVGACILVLTGFLSFTVDFGRVQLCRIQLRDTVEAAARAAAAGISDGTYLAKAQAIASANTIDTTTLTLQSTDVELGVWNASNKVFTATSNSPNAVRVTGRRTAARGTAIPLVFAQVIGKSSIDLSTSSVVMAASSSGADIVGTSGVTLTGGTLIKRLASESGTVRVASNSGISVPWGCYIYGDAYYRNTAPSEPGDGITGASTSMTSNISLPSVSAPPGTPNIGAINVGWQGANYAAGTYSCTSITFGGGGTVNVTGDVNLYCSGNVDMGNGAILNTSNGAYKVTIYLTGNNTANLNLSSAFHMRLYGPNATVNLDGGSPLVGSVMVKNLNLNGSGNISYSSPLSLANVAGLSSGSSEVSTVK